MKDSANKENIELSLPVNAAYVSAARQTAFTIAGRLGFDADEAEDVKTAVSEACAFVIKKLASGRVPMFKILFIPNGDSISVKLSCAGSPRAKEGASPDMVDDYSLLLIRNLMDTFDIIDNDSLFEISMTKQHINSFLDTRG